MESDEALVIALVSSLFVLTPCYQPIQDEFLFLVKAPL